MSQGQGRSGRILAAGRGALFVLITFTYGVGAGVYHWPPFSLMKSVPSWGRNARPDGAGGGDALAQGRVCEKPGGDRAVAEIAAIVRSESGPAKARQAEFVRQFVYRNSVHRIDDEYQCYAWDRPRVLRMLYQHHRTRQNPPHLSCGPRAIAMQSILDALEIESRLVHTFTDDYDDVRSHTFLEVHDEEAGRWVIHDPDYDVSYVDARSDRPVPLIRLVLGDLASVVPVSSRGRGWELNKAEHLKTQFFEAARYEGQHGGCDILVINSDRFSLTKRFPGNDQMTFREFAEQKYHRPIVLVNPTVSSF